MVADPARTPAIISEARWKLEVITEDPAIPISQIGIEHDMTEFKTQRMNLPQWITSQKFACTKTGENLEVNWSVAARLVGGLKGAARRVGLAMTDQELSPTAKNIPDNGERKADRNRRGIEALMAKLETATTVLCHEQAPEEAERACH